MRLEACTTASRNPCSPYTLPATYPVMNPAHVELSKCVCLLRPSAGSSLKPGVGTIDGVSPCFSQAAGISCWLGRSWVVLAVCGRAAGLPAELPGHACAMPLRQCCCALTLPTQEPVYLLSYLGVAPCLCASKSSLPKHALPAARVFCCPIRALCVALTVGHRRPNGVLLTSWLCWSQPTAAVYRLMIRSWVWTSCSWQRSLPEGCRSQTRCTGSDRSRSGIGCVTVCLVAVLAAWHVAAACSEQGCAIWHQRTTHLLLYRLSCWTMALT